MVLTVVLGWTVWDASRHEWEPFQASYRAILGQQAETDLRFAEYARSQRDGIKQLEPKGLGTVERCVTCHLAFDNPMFEDAAEPLRTHSSILKSHPPGRFGCVVCHGGEGRAVTTLEAHGQGDILAKPLLRGTYMQAACFNCHGERTLPSEATAAVIRGRQLVNRYLCLGCHQINGEGGEEGPDLTGVGSHRNWLWLYAHLLRPQGIVVGSTMPVYPLSRNEIRDTTIYLMTLLSLPDQMRIMPLRAERVVTSEEAWPARARPLNGASSATDSSPGSLQYEGGILFRGAGCRLCHTVGSHGGHVGPSLTYIAHKRTPEDLDRLLRDPEQVFPGGKMPQLHLSERQVRALVNHLGFLR